MKNSTSALEFDRFVSLLRNRRKFMLRIADYCAYALYKNKNYSMSANELMTAIIALGFKTEGATLNKTISSIIRYQNKGMFDEPRNGKFRLKKSIVRKFKEKPIKRKMKNLFHRSHHKKDGV